MASDMAAMPLMEHLRELRGRLLWCVLAVGAGMALSFFVSQRVMAGLQQMCSVCQFIAIDPTEGITTYFRVSLVLGLVLALPIILYQIVRFVAPGLHSNEKRYLYVMIPAAALLFALGIAFGYFLVLPRTVNFLALFTEGPVGVRPAWRVGNYIAFVTNLLLVIGLAFETPLVVFVLSRIGLLTPAFMAHYRRYFWVGAAVLAAVLTPTPDPFTMFMVLIPMIILYEFGILLARLF